MTPKLGFECKIDRIELASHVEDEDKLIWEVSGTVIPELSNDVMLLQGHLWVVAEGIWGQVGTVGWLQRAGVGDMSGDALKRFTRTYVDGLTEEMYDVGRRALLANAALADFELNLPFKAPSNSVELIDPAELSFEPQGATNDAEGESQG